MPILVPRKRLAGFLGSANLRVTSSFFDHTKKIIHVETGDVYDMDTICKVFKMNKTQVYKKMKHKVDVGEDYTFMYIDNN